MHVSVHEAMSTGNGVATGAPLIVGAAAALTSVSLGNC
jgi:hypothetical protein